MSAPAMPTRGELQAAAAALRRVEVLPIPAGLTSDQRLAIRKVVEQANATVAAAATLLERVEAALEQPARAGRPLPIGARVRLSEPEGWRQPYRRFGQSGRIATIEAFDADATFRAPYRIRFDKLRSNAKAITLHVYAKDVTICEEEVAKQ